MYLIKNSLKYFVILWFIFISLMGILLFPFGGIFFVLSCILCFVWLILIFISKNYRQYILYNLPFWGILIYKICRGNNDYVSPEIILSGIWAVPFILSLFHNFDPRNTLSIKDICFCYFFSILFFLFVVLML